MTIIPISKDTDKKLHELQKALNKKRKKIIKEAIIYLIDKRFGGDKGVYTLVWEEEHGKEYRGDDK